MRQRAAELKKAIEDKYKEKEPTVSSVDGKAEENEMTDKCYREEDSAVKKQLINCILGDLFW